MSQKNIKVTTEAIFPDPDEPCPEWRKKMFMEGMMEMAVASGAMERHIKRLQRINRVAS